MPFARLLGVCGRLIVLFGVWTVIVLFFVRASAQAFLPIRGGPFFLLTRGRKMMDDPFDSFIHSSEDRVRSWRLLS